MDGEITTAEQFYNKLKMELKEGQVLYTTRYLGRDTGGRDVRFSRWEKDGRLRFHLPINRDPRGTMRFITIEEIKKVYNVYEPGNFKKLGRQIDKICNYKDIRKSVLKQLVIDYG